MYVKKEGICEKIIRNSLSLLREMSNVLRERETRIVSRLPGVSCCIAVSFCGILCLRFERRKFRAALFRAIT